MPSMLRTCAMIFIVLQSFLLIRFSFTSVVEKQNQEIRCTRGQAMSNIEWTLVEKNYRTYRVDCVNIPGASCDDKCIWSLSCQTAEYGLGLYSRGVNVLYDPLNEKQAYMLYLCCNMSTTVKTPKCEQTMIRRYGVTARSNSSYIRETHASNPFEKSAHGWSLDHVDQLQHRNTNDEINKHIFSAKMWWDSCSIDNRQLRTRRETSVCHHHGPDRPPYDPRLHALWALAALAALSALALIKKKPPPTCSQAFPGTTRYNVDLDFATAATYYRLEPITIDECCAYCLSPGYTGCNFFPPGSYDIYNFYTIPTCFLDTNTGPQRYPPVGGGTVLFTP